MSRLNRDDWSRAALAVISEQGVAGLAVEPLAAQLGTTKGSFYWHFTSRDELVGAALELWEQRSTTAVIEQVESADADPEASLRVAVRAGLRPRTRWPAPMSHCSRTTTTPECARPSSG